MRNPSLLFQIVSRVISMHLALARLTHTRPERGTRGAAKHIYVLLQTLDQARQMAVWFAYLFTFLVSGPMAWPELPWPQLSMSQTLTISLALSLLRCGICGGLMEFYENELLELGKNNERN